MTQMYRKTKPGMSIFIHHGPATLKIQSTDQPAFASSPAVIEKAMKDLIAFRQPDSPLLTLNIEDTLSRLATRFRWIEAAGGIIKDKAGKILLIHRRGHWDLPKGKIDEGETPQVAAVREIREETGLSQLIELEACSPTYHIYPMQEHWFLKKTHWFQYEMRTDQPLLLQTEEDITDARWMDTDEIRLVWMEIYPSLKPLLEKIIG